MAAEASLRNRGGRSLPGERPIGTLLYFFICFNYVMYVKKQWNPVLKYS